MSRLPALALLALSATASAQEEGPALPEPTVIYKEVTELEIEGTTVEGTIVKPTVGFIHEPNRKGFAPMIRLRHDFNAEMAESVDLVQ